MLKTYNARTMAEALAQVKRDLGRDAVIVHTRAFRVGGVMGFGGRPMVEVTATSGKAAGDHAPRRMPTRAVGRVPVIQRDETPDNPAAQLASSIVTKPIRPAVRHPMTQNPGALAVAAGVAASHDELVEERAALYTNVQPNAAYATQKHPRTPDTTSADPVHDAPARPEPDRPDDNGRHVLERAASVLAERAARLEQAQAAPGERQTLELMLDRPSRPTAPAPEAQYKAQPELKPEPKPVEPAASPPTIEAKPFAPPAAEHASPQSPEALEREIGELRRMMGQVLQSTRRTEARSGGAGAFGGATPEPLLDLYTKLTDAEVDADEAEKIVGEVRDVLGPDELRDERIVRETALRQLERRLPTRADQPSERREGGRPSVIALVGPTGVGKTTTVAKLAATHKLRHGKKVGLITTDTYRIAAVEQLRTYAGIIGLPLKVAMTPADVASAIEALNDCDVVVIDTAGRSQNDAKRLDELKAFLVAAKADQTHMVLSTTVGRRVLERTVERFGALSPDRAILTKLDEAESFGMILEAARLCGLPISYVTTGQEVPDDMEAARPERLARMVLGAGVEVGR